MILKNILRYYYENDIKKFYKVYNSEVELITGSKIISKLEYDRLLDYAAKNYLINTPLTVQKTPQSKAGVVNFVSRLGGSIKRDGLYLTGEKIVRKVYTKATNKRH